MIPQGSYKFKDGVLHFKGADGSVSTYDQNTGECLSGTRDPRLVEYVQKTSGVRRVPKAKAQALSADTADRRGLIKVVNNVTA